MSNFKSWDELSRKEQLIEIHYDFYKEVYGIRPRWVKYSELSEELLEREIQYLQTVAETVAYAT